MFLWSCCCLAMIHPGACGVTGCSTLNSAYKAQHSKSNNMHPPRALQASCHRIGTDNQGGGGAGSQLATHRRQVLVVAVTMIVHQASLCGKSIVRATTCTRHGRCMPAATGSAPAIKPCNGAGSWLTAHRPVHAVAVTMTVRQASLCREDRERAPWLTHGHGGANELCDVCSQLQTVVVHQSTSCSQQQPLPHPCLLCQSRGLRAMAPLLATLPRGQSSNRMAVGASSRGPLVGLRCRPVTPQTS